MFIGIFNTQVHSLAIYSMLTGRYVSVQGETKAKFVERVQQQIAEELRIPIYDYTVQSKKKLVNSLKAAGGELR